MYCESYTAETDVLNEKADLMSEFIQMQKKNEYSENRNVQDYLERKIRAMQENVDKYWRCENAKDK